MQKVSTGVRMVMINRGLSWIVFDILKSCGKQLFKFCKILIEYRLKLHVNA